ncbi:hypothetical protein VST63_18135 [Mycolicibacterium sp. 050232]|uniref:hypothetical protein n=1 Tax=Mycolicibacterium sp. 050232 TaxID=3113982 RepID=UPI002E28FEF8|nr:hypothetical protein [Mycolicibacterium sp. 050232]MED5814285.1 hypothetical protein [Mycolicibacterium sp. 050232]
MSGFGNEMGALFGGEMFTSFAPNWTTSEWNTLMGDGGPPSRWNFDGDSLENQSPVGIKKEEHVPDKDPAHIDTSTLDEIPGLTSDQSVQDAVTAATTGGKAINWESWTFGELRAEAAALKPADINTLASNWTTHGTNLKEDSETFKEKVGDAITGKWSGDSATTAEAASKQVTKTSIYDFAASSEEISDRLKVLSAAFDTVQTKFKEFENHNLIDDVENKNWQNLQDEVTKFNNEYHFDDSGHLRNRDGGYVNVDTAVDAKKRLQQSIDDYTAAVQVFDDTYAPAIAAVATNFPNLPPLPNMKFEAPTGDPTGPGGPGGPGGTSPFTPGGGGPGGIKPLDKSALDKLNANKPTDLDKLKPIDQKPIDQKDLTTDPTKDALESLTDPTKSAMDTATNAAKDAIGQAMDAAKNAAQNPLGQGMGGPPEGVLGLGPQGLGGAGAGAGKGAGGAGGGVPLRGMPSGLPSSAPATAAAKMPAGAAGAGAGLGSGAGSPGAGAPAAGQRAGDQNGKGHQVNKALRRKKNGKDVIGDAEAAVPVVGADEDAAQAENAPADKSEPRRRIPQRGGTTWQPDSAVQPGPARQPQSPHLTPGRSE